MQATFGPTRGSLAELGGTTYEAWIQEQMQLPTGSHREYYRARVNPTFNPEMQLGFNARSPCSQGSRWHNHAFIVSDIGKLVDVADSGSGTWRILVDGVARSDIHASDTGDSCTDVGPAWWQA